MNKPLRPFYPPTSLSRPLFPMPRFPSFAPPPREYAPLCPTHVQDHAFTDPEPPHTQGLPTTCP